MNADMSKRWTDYWMELPASIRQFLVVGVVGKIHLLHLANRVFKSMELTSSAQRQKLLALGHDLLLSAWEEDPIDVSIARQLSKFQAHAPLLSPDLAAVISQLSTKWQDPSLDPSSLDLPPDREECRTALEEKVSQSPESMQLWQTVMQKSLQWGEYAWAEMLLQSHRWSGLLERLRFHYLGQLAYLQKAYDRWQENLLHRGGTLSDANRSLQLGNLAFSLGDRRRALAFWQRSLAIRPWQTNLLLRTYDAVTGMDTAGKPLQGSLSICLYTYNKAAELAVTLADLAQSDLGDARIFVLVNGCTDTTREVVKSWQNRLGTHRLAMIDLPINIGAPAARNWLMHHPEVTLADWIAYLDDDALVPKDWLFLLGAAVERYPHAGTWGCRVVDADLPAILQSVDYHLLFPPDAEDSPDTCVPFVPSMLHYESYDQGQFSYMRPCVHVTGCCHLFSREMLSESGDFDLRFSPSQFDDLEHDIRLARSGKPAVYQGHLAVRHMNKTAKDARVNMSQRGSAGANRYKLHHKYSREDYRELIYWGANLVEQDLLRKTNEIGDHGGTTARR